MTNRDEVGEWASGEVRRTTWRGVAVTNRISVMRVAVRVGPDRVGEVGEWGATKRRGREAGVGVACSAEVRAAPALYDRHVGGAVGLKSRLDGLRPRSPPLRTGTLPPHSSQPEASAVAMAPSPRMGRGVPPAGGGVRVVAVPPPTWIVLGIEAPRKGYELPAGGQPYRWHRRSSPARAEREHPTYR